MNRVLLAGGLFAVALCTAAAAAAQATGVIGAMPSRQAEDRRVDDSSRHTQTARQTEAPKPAESQKHSDAPARSDPKPAFQRQAEPQRQPEPQRQHEPHRQPELSRQNNTGHWDDPGPAWRPQGPAWRDLNDRPGVRRPGEDALRPNGNASAPRNRDKRRNDNSNTSYGYPYVAFGYAPYVEFAPEPAPEPALAVDEPLGFLQLRVQPRTADVYVDGALAGTVDDFGGRGARQLPAGPRRVELVAPGYETLTFDVRVPENDTVTFTRELDRAVERPTPAAVVIPHKALYVVPQCYIGDRMPLPTDMPAGCRVEDVRVIP